MRWPWNQRRATAAEAETATEDRAGYGDLLLAGLEATVSGDVGNILRSSAVEVAAGTWARVLSAATVTGAPALTREVRAIIGRQLIRAGEVAFVIQVRDGRLRLAPVAQFEVLAGWRYRAEVIEPPGKSTSRIYPSVQVLHFRWQVNPREPWAGISPLGSARLLATATANLESKIGQETSGPSALLLPVPTGGTDIGQLGQDIASAKGAAVLAEATSTGWDEGRQAAGTREDFKASRLGPMLPEEMIQAYRDTLGRVAEACGIPAALVDPSTDGTGAREAYRRFVMASVEPVAERLADEAAEKLEADVSFDFSGVWAHDLQSRAAAFQKLVAGGMDVERAARLSGILVADE